MPSAPSTWAPAVAIEGDKVLIQWVAPHDGSTPITSYQILIREHDFVTWSEETINCDGTVAEIMNNV